MAPDTLYDIDFTEDDRLLRATLRGFWDSATMAQFARDIAVWRRELIHRYGSYNTLFDAKAFTVQTPEIVDAFQHMQVEGRGLNTGRIAMVVDGALARIQARRTVIDDRIAILDNCEDGLAWLAAAPLTD